MDNIRPTKCPILGNMSISIILNLFLINAVLINAMFIKCSFVKKNWSIFTEVLVLHWYVRNSLVIIEHVVKSNHSTQLFALLYVVK